MNTEILNQMAGGLLSSSGYPDMRSSNHTQMPASIHQARGDIGDLGSSRVSKSGVVNQNLQPLHVTSMYTGS